MTIWKLIENTPVPWAVTEVNASTFGEYINRSLGGGGEKGILKIPAKSEGKGLTAQQKEKVWGKRGWEIAKQFLHQ